MLGGRDPVGVDRLDVVGVGLAAPADEEALGDRARPCRPRVCGTGGWPAPRADCATNDSAMTEARARSSRACSSVMSMSCPKPHSGASIASADWTSTRGSPERTRERMRLGGRQARARSVPSTSRPQTCSNGTCADEVLDVDAAVAQRAALLVGLGDLGGEGDDAFEAGLDAARVDG